MESKLLFDHIWTRALIAGLRASPLSATTFCFFVPYTNNFTASFENIIGIWMIVALISLFLGLMGSIFIFLPLLWYIGEKDLSIIEGYIIGQAILTLLFPVAGLVLIYFVFDFEVIGQAIMISAFVSSSFSWAWLSLQRKKKLNNKLEIKSQQYDSK